MARHGRAPRGRRPIACTETTRAGTGRSTACLGKTPRPCREAERRTPMMNEQGKSDGAVDLLRSPEQSRDTTGGGGDGGKRSGQGELVRAKHPPDTRPGKGAKCAGTGTSKLQSERESSSSRASCITLPTWILCGRRISAQPQAGCRERRGWDDVEAPRGRSWRLALPISPTG